MRSEASVAAGGLLMILYHLKQSSIDDELITTGLGLRVHHVTATLV